MGGRFSQLNYRQEDVALRPEFAILASSWTFSHIRGLAHRLRLISFNFCVSPAKLAELLQLEQNEFFQDLVHTWFTCLRNSPSSSVVNGLELLAALALTVRQGKLAERAACVFDVFDFDDSGSITRDELVILLKASVRGLGKLTQGLAGVFERLVPLDQLEALAAQCLRAADRAEEAEVSRDEFVQWCRATPRVRYLVQQFVPAEPLHDGSAAVRLQAWVRMLQAHRRLLVLQAARDRDEQAQAHEAAGAIQGVMRGYKTRREQMHAKKLAENAWRGGVVSFGANARNQLGHADAPHARVHRPRLLDYFKAAELRVASVSTASLHSCATTTDGNVYTWGDGVPGALGHFGDPTSSKSSSNESSTPTPTRVEDLEHVRVVDAVVGARHTAAVTDAGQVLTWGSAEFGQLGLGDFEDDNTGMYKTGYDWHMGRNYRYVDLPLTLDQGSFGDRAVAQVACGYYFTVAVTDNGVVYAWGEGSEGQLGIGDSPEFAVGFLDEYIQRSNFTYMPTPQRVGGALEGHSVKQVAVGGNHVMAVSRGQEVFEWGAWGRRKGQWTEPQWEPVLIDELQGLCVASVACGPDHSLALTNALAINMRTGAQKSTVHHRFYAVRAKFGPHVSDVARGVRADLVHVELPFDDEDDDPRNAAAPPYGGQFESFQDMLAQSFAGLETRGVLLDRGRAPGVWITDDETGTSCFALEAKFGPKISRAGLRAETFYDPNVTNLKYYVRPDQIPGRVVFIDFGDDDLKIGADEEDPDKLVYSLMVHLVKQVRDAEQSQAAAVVIVFDFHDAEPFSLEDVEEDGDPVTIPALMVSKADGDKLKAGLRGTLHVSRQRDTLMRKILSAGVAMVVVAQNPHQERPVQLEDAELARVEQLATSSSASGKRVSAVSIPVVMVSSAHGDAIKAILGDRDNSASALLDAHQPGDVYAWGYGEDGRLGLGDTDNDRVFRTGYDAHADVSYQYVHAPELVSAVAGVPVSQVACGDDHSAAVTADGLVYTWGSAEGSRLGHGAEEDDEDEFVPRQVEDIPPCAARVACGDAHTMVVTALAPVPPSAPRTGRPAGPLGDAGGAAAGGAGESAGGSGESAGGGD